MGRSLRRMAHMSVPREKVRRVMRSEMGRRNVGGFYGVNIEIKSVFDVLRCFAIGYTIQPV